MDQPKPLAPKQLCSLCEPDQFDFQTTAELQPLDEVIGQERALQAMHFGVDMQRHGYNIYVMGPPGIGKHSMVNQLLELKRDEQTTPPDWAYVNNFDAPHKPIALRLPAGWGKRLNKDMEQLLEELSVTVPSVFESDEYRNQHQAIEDELKERQEAAFGELTQESGEQRVKLFRTPSGFAFAPLDDKDEVIGPEEFEQLSAEEQAAIEAKVGVLQDKLKAILHQIPQWRKESHEALRKLNHDVAMSAVGHLIEQMEEHYSDLPEVLNYLEQVQTDVVDNVKDFLDGEDGERSDMSAVHRYKVNVVVDNSETQGAPVVYLDHAAYQNLVGRSEHLAQMGTLVTDFTLIKPGALHEACGGYLLLDAHKLLTQPYAWEGLKRALHSSEIRIEPLEKMLGLLSTVSLEPQPIPLDVKVVLMGDRMLYYLLHAYDPDFGELFKVQADFEEQIRRDPESQALYARLIATLASKESLRPFDRGAVARIIEYAARLEEDSERLSTHMRSSADLLHEADYWAERNALAVTGAAEVQQAIDQQQHRASRIRERVQEAIERGTIHIATDGTAVGQVNGLSVLQMGNYSFGQPSRITATVHIGEGQVVDIEREVEMGGPIHSKGVLILSSFIATRYAQKQPLSLSASLVFEQSYGGVDGDSASMAELCALLSAIAGAPIKQGWAMTGSVDQFGRMQPIGGVNEKIEGFFDVCKTRGLNGEQGVLIPADNVKHLMLRHDVVEACAEGRFRIVPLQSVDQAMEQLTGQSIGLADEQGEFPEGSLNGRIVARLTEMALIRQHFGEHKDKEKEGDKGEEEKNEKEK